MAKKTSTVKKTAKVATRKSPAKKKAAKTARTAGRKSEVKKAAAKKATVKKSAPVKKVKPVKEKKSDGLENGGPAEKLVMNIVEGMKERKAKNIVVLGLKKIQNRVSDYFVICEADSNTHVDSIADSVEEEVRKKTGEKPFHSEGWTNSQWILMDYVNVVAHIFQTEIRGFYNLEGMWADAEITEIKN